MASKKYPTRKSSKSYAKAAPSVDYADLLKQSQAAAIDSLVVELAAGKSEGFVRYLSFVTRFHNYSFGNILLIAEQCPDATRVAGYKTWEALGYQVAKGSKSIRIFAPRPYEVKTGKTDEATGDEKTRKGLTFVPVPVFDASQLTPESVAAKPFPAFWRDLGSDEASNKLQNALIDAMQAEGIAVQEAVQIGTGDTQGVSTGGMVYYRNDKGARGACDTLAHEWAHEILHQSDKWKEASKGRDRKEVVRVQELHAEAVAYVVLNHFGIHSELAADYLLNWGATAERVAEELGYIQQAATHIITACEKAAAEAA